MAKKNKGQQRVLGEIQKQLMLQAERWGRKDYYTPQRMEEMVLDQCYKIKGDFLGEKANLEYELQQVDSDKKESLIKLEKLVGYLKKADRSILGHQKAIIRSLEKLVGDKVKTKWALDYKKISKKGVSIMIGEN